MKVKRGVDTRVAEQSRRRSARERLRKKRLRTLMLGLTAAVGVFVAVYIIGSYIRITELKDQISEKQQRIETLDSQYVALNNRLADSLELAYVEDYAENVLGLTRTDSNQEEYLEIEKPDRIEVSSGSNGMQRLVASFVKSFSAIMSFLR
ncbi:MAG: hypothetical protein ACI4PQ_03325 [Butyricicoccaceae bacterium]